MREHLYRAKDIESGKWVYGNLIETQDGEYTEYAILEKTAEHRCCGEYGDYGWYAVDKETIGEYTGLTDKDGKKIFEGDIVVDLYSYENKRILGALEYTEGSFDSGIYRYMGFCYRDKRGKVDHTNIYQRLFSDEEMEVMGNIYDNPELLKK